MVNQSSFGTLPDGRAVDRYVLTSSAVELHIISYGAIITALRTPDQRGRWQDVVLGYQALAPYLRNDAYIGAVVGRYANRIANGRFELDGATYQLAANDGAHHLHGGIQGFDRHVWSPAVVHVPEGVAVSFSRTSPSFEEHYPGALHAVVTYLLRTDNVVQIEYSAVADAPTPVNLTQHSYFNLSGDTRRTILDHDLTIHADRFTPVDSTLIPTGSLAAVDETPFDFRTARRIDDQLHRSHDQLRAAKGFDHNWVLDGGAPQVRPAAKLREPSSGRVLEIATTEPGLQFYDGHSLGGGAAESSACSFPSHSGLCLETQHFPDSPNHPQFPSTLLRPGREYRSLTTWTFSLD